MTKSNTVQHQNMSKTRHQNGKKNTSSQMLLDHCYTFGLLLWPSNSEEVVPLTYYGPALDPLCGFGPKVNTNVRESWVLPNACRYCYAFSLLLQHSTLKEKFFGEGAPHWRIMALLWICPWADLAQKWIQMSGVLSTLSLQSLVNIHQVIL